LGAGLAVAGRLRGFAFALEGPAEAAGRGAAPVWTDGVPPAAGPSPAGVWPACGPDGGPAGVGEDEAPALEPTPWARAAPADAPAAAAAGRAARPDREGVEAGAVPRAGADGLPAPPVGFELEFPGRTA
jgi:hypothetical protein